MRAPPVNIAAEKMLLGGIFAHNRIIEQLSEFLKPEHFALVPHAIIYKTCQAIVEAGHVADPVTLGSHFTQTGGLDDIGGPPYLSELANSAAPPLTSVEYGYVVYDCAMRRQLIEVADELAGRAYAAEADETAGQIQESIEGRLFEIGAGIIGGGPVHVAEYVKSALEAAEVARSKFGLTGLSTGLRDLDNILGGFHPSDLIIVAGRPSMGKTALATNIAFRAAGAGTAALCFSLEMSGEQLTMREICGRAGYSSHLVRTGHVTEDGLSNLSVAGGTIKEIPLFIDERPSLKIQMMRTVARRMKRKHDIGLVIVDYLQLAGAEVGRREFSRTQEVSEITRGLKAIAKELNVPVVAVSQLSRAVEGREDKRPMLSDLRESGTIEQDSDVVMFIYREEYYLDQKQPSQRDSETEATFSARRARWQALKEKCQNVATLIIAKQRHGPIGSFDIRFSPELTQFTDLTRVEYEP